MRNERQRTSGASGPPRVQIRARDCRFVSARSSFNSALVARGGRVAVHERMRGVSVRDRRRLADVVAIARQRAVRRDPVGGLEAVGAAALDGTPGARLHFLVCLGGLPRGPHPATRVAQLPDCGYLFVRVVLLRLRVSRIVHISMLYSYMYRTSVLRPNEELGIEA